MITLSNGFQFEYTAASGALSYDGRGWIWDRALERIGLLDTSELVAATPSLTLYPREGNLKMYAPWRCIRPIKDGYVNAKGLTNPGLGWWIKNREPRLDRKLVVNIYSQSLDELTTMGVMLKSHRIAACELNASCPNSGETFYSDSKNVLLAARRFKEACDHPLIVKVSVTHDLEFLADALQPYAEALSINSVPWHVVFPPNKKSPLAHLGGGAVSGKAAQPWTWDAVNRLTELSSIPVIGPSVWQYEDIERVRQYGASAISFGSVFLRYPHKVTDWVRRDVRQRLHRRRLRPGGSKTEGR